MQVRHDQPPISIVEILNPTIEPEDLVSKSIILDILARDVDGLYFVIEMQLRRYLHWAERNNYYLARGLASQLKAGEDYRHLRPAIGISLLASDLFTDEPDKACWHFTLRDMKRQHVSLGESLQVHIIELRKAERLYGLPSALTDWIACLLHSLNEDAMSQITDPPAQEALQHLEELYSDQELRLLAERRERAIIDDLDARAFERQEGLNEGIGIGVERGKVEGIEIGVERGIGIGVEQGKANMLTQLLTRKFGALATNMQQRLSSASQSDLDAWALNVLDAATLEDVFKAEN